MSSISYRVFSGHNDFVKTAKGMPQQQGSALRQKMFFIVIFQLLQVLGLVVAETLEELRHRRTAAVFAHVAVELKGVFRHLQLMLVFQLDQRGVPQNGKGGLILDGSQRLQVVSVNAVLHLQSRIAGS